MSAEVGLQRGRGGLSGTAPSPPRVEGKTPAVLAFHGFGGTTREVELVVEAAQRSGLRAVAPLLPGHGTHARDLARMRFEDFCAAAERALDELRGEGPVIAAGLSLGSLLAAHLAVTRASSVAGLVLLANAVWLRSPFPAWALRAAGALKLPDFLMPRGPSDLGDPEARRTQISYTADPVRAAIDVERAGAQIRAELPQVHCPTLILHGARDRLCPVSNAWRAAELLGTRDARVVIFPRSHHILTRDLESAAVSRELSTFFERVAALPRQLPVEP